VGTLSGVQYIGYLAEATGFGEAARRHARVLADAGVAVSLESMALGNDGPIAAPPHPARFPGLDYPGRRCFAPCFTIVHTPPTAFPLFARTNAHRIGFTAWETARLPQGWSQHLDEVDELWVPSEFSATAFRHATKRPVRVVHHPVWSIEGGCRSFPGVPDDLFLFAAILDWQDRKNPRGLVRAFGQAFAGHRDVGLLLKLSPWANRAEVMRVLNEELAGVGQPPKVFVIFDELLATSLGAIYRRADAFVSLHRAEGFGLTMAEAMVAGVPLVATAYSANLEFMKPAHALLVPYRLVPARQTLSGGFPFDASMSWAEPDEDDAVAALRSCYLERSAAQRRARAAKAHVRALLAPAKVGQQMRGLLGCGSAPERFGERPQR
jgi:glycosyltransferase involved in cell wall biosynthesis